MASRYDSDAVNSPPKKLSYYLDPDLTPSCINLLMAVKSKLHVTALVTPSCIISPKTLWRVTCNLIIRLLVNE